MQKQPKHNQVLDLGQSSQKHSCRKKKKNIELYHSPCGKVKLKYVRSLSIKTEMLNPLGDKIDKTLEVVDEARIF